MPGRDRVAVLPPAVPTRRAGERAGVSTARRLTGARPTGRRPGWRCLSTRQSRVAPATIAATRGRADRSTPALGGFQKLPGYTTVSGSERRGWKTKSEPPLNLVTATSPVRCAGVRRVPASWSSPASLPVTTAVSPGRAAVVMACSASVLRALQVDPGAVVVGGAAGTRIAPLENSAST